MKIAGTTLKKWLLGALVVAGVLAVGVFMYQKKLPFARGDMLPGSQGRVVLLNWESYTDPTVLQAFEAQTGIAVELQEYKVEEDLAREIAHRADQYDVIICSGDSLGTYRKEAKLKKLNPEWIPNARYVDARLRCYPDYAVPYLVGTTGLAVNTNYVDASSLSWKILWNPRYRGKIALLDDMHEVLAILLFRDGYSANAVDAKALAVAQENARQLKENQVIFSDTWDNIGKLRSGEKWIIQVYSGDIAADTVTPYTTTKFFLPQEGYSIWIDHLTISNLAPHPREAHMLMNFMLQPQIAARAGNRFHYMAPVRGSEKFVDQEFRSITQDLLSGEAMKKGEFLMSDLGPVLAEYESIYKELKGEEPVSEKSPDPVGPFTQDTSSGHETTAGLSR